MPVQTAIQVRRGTASSWTSTNPTLAAGEIGFETDTGKFKIGTGSTAWASLAYAAIDAGLLAAKGDLVTATANDTPAVLTVGSNGDTLVADSSASTGLRWSAGNPIVNPVINGGFDIWQRGTSLSGAGVYPYTADRFTAVRAGYAAGSTISRQDTNDTTNLPSIRYCARVQRDSGNTSTAYIELATTIETANSIPFAGKPVTFSFYARKGANYSEANGILVSSLVSGTGTDQFYTSFTSAATVATTNASLTTTWQRFTVTGTVGATAKELSISFSYTPSGTAGAADYFEVTGVQVDIGSVALPFRRSGGTLAGELCAAQRYYYRANADGTGYPAFGNGTAATTSQAYALINFPVIMRTKPTALEQSGTASDYGCTNAAYSTINCNTVPTFLNASTRAATISVTVASGLVAGDVVTFYSNNTTNAYLGWSAEL